MEQSAYVSINGQPIDIDKARADARASAPPASRAKVKARSGKDHEDFMSLGFVVEGLTHAMLANARDARQRAIDGYESACEQAKSEHRAAPKKPVPFDEDQWLSTAKRMKVVSRPYEIRSAAEQCRELALKQGWLAVSVVEVRRERKS